MNYKIMTGPQLLDQKDFLISLYLREARRFMKIVLVYILIQTQHCLYLNKVLRFHGNFESTKGQITFLKSQGLGINY